MTDDNIADPTGRSRWRPLRLLLDAMDADIARIYADYGDVLDIQREDGG